MVRLRVALLALFAFGSVGFTLTVRRRASDKVGYLVTSFPYEDQAVYMHLSNGNDAHSLTQLSRDGTIATSAILRSTVGTQGVRDTQIVSSPDGTKFWLIATDMKGNDFAASTKFGSRRITIWESPNLVDWSPPRLSPELVDTRAGYVWAPEANWDPSLDAFVIVWATGYWPDSNPKREGGEPASHLYFATTQDFVDFSPAQPYFAPEVGALDATFLRYAQEGQNVWYRWVKSQAEAKIFQQKSIDGILGQWTNVGGASNSTRITFGSELSNTEGPLAFRDNLDPGLFHYWVDSNSRNSYSPATSRTLDDMAAWKAEPLAGFPAQMKHGGVFPVNQAQYDAIKAAFPAVS